MKPRRPIMRARLAWALLLLGSVSLVVDLEAGARDEVTTPVAQASAAATGAPTAESPTSRRFAVRAPTPPVLPPAPELGPSALPLEPAEADVSPLEPVDEDDPEFQRAEADVPPLEPVEPEAPATDPT